MNEDKRLIEETFPVREVSAESVHEKNIRRGHISTLHIWWARLPLASSRATSYAALVETPKDINEWSQKRDLIISLSKWENSLNALVLKRAQKEILEANDGVPPKVLDPFGGGGAIPLEALRLGCETYSSDLNPVAVLIQKCTLEYPQKYGRSTEDINETILFEEAVENPLLEDVRKWGNWVLAESKKEMERFYPRGVRRFNSDRLYLGKDNSMSKPVVWYGYPLDETILVIKEGKKEGCPLSLR